MIYDGDNLPEIRQGWAWTTLSEVIKIRSGFAFKSRDYQDDGTILIRQSNIGEVGVNVSKAVHLPEEFLDRCSDFTIRKGDIIVGMSGSIGKSCVYDLDVPALQNQRTGVVLFFEPQTKMFIRYYLDTLESRLASLAKGVAVQNISARQIESCPLPLPPLPEQHRIVEKIEELFTRLDAGIASLKKTQAQLKRYRQAVLKAAVTGKLTEEWREAHKDELEPASVLLERILKERREKWEAEELEKFEAKGKVPKDDRWKRKYEEFEPPGTEEIPESPAGWEWVAWEQIGFSQNGRAFPSKFYDSKGIRLLRPGNLHESGTIVWTGANTRHMPEDWAVDHKSYVVAGGELVMNLTAQSLRDEFLGRVCMTSENERCLLNQRIARLRPVLANPKYLLWLFKSSIFRRFVASLNTGSLIQHMFTSQLAEFILPLPPLAEQREIAHVIERSFSVADEVQSTIESELKRAERLRQSILKQAFSGKLVPQDPTDEPASVLLERLRVEKAARESEKKAKGRSKPKRKARKSPEQIDLF